MDLLAGAGAVDLSSPVPPEPGGVYQPGDRVALERQYDGYILVDGEGVRSRGEGDDLARKQRPDDRLEVFALSGKRAAAIQVRFGRGVFEELRKVGQRLDGRGCLPEVAACGGGEPRDQRDGGGLFGLGAAVGVEPAGLAAGGDVPGEIGCRAAESPGDGGGELLGSGC